MEIAPPNTRLSSSKRFLLVCFTLFSVLVGIIGASLYHYQKQNIINTTKAKLTILADLKADQVHNWRLEQISRSQLLTGNPFLLQLIQEYLLTHKQTTKQQIMANLAPALGKNGAHTIVLLDKDRQPVLQSGEKYVGAPLDEKTYQRIVEKGHPCFSNIYSFDNISAYSTTSADLHMNIVALLHINNDVNMPVIGSLIMVIDPNIFFLSLLKNWSDPSASAESVLIRKNTDTITPITTRRFCTDSGISEVHPVDEITSPGQLIKKGQEGFVTGYDYRNVAIFAAVKKVPDSSWFLVTKIDQTEVLSTLLQLSAIILAAIMLIISAVGMIMWLWWRRQQVISRAHQYKHELQNRTIITRFDNLTRYSNDIIVLCDEDGNIIDANNQALDAYGKSLEELREHQLRTLCDISASECDKLWQQLAVNNKIKFDTLQFRRDGSNFPVEINASWIKVGERRLLQAIIRDVSERKEAASLLLHQAQHDPLTSLPNRTLLADRLHQSLSNGKRHGHQTGLLCLDIDRFKNINETLGHGKGDTVLTTVAQRIKNKLRETDTVARFGGDEFMVLIEDVRAIGDVANLAIKLLKVISQPIFIDQKEVYVTTSIGISIGPDDSDQTDMLIRYAETALYRAKEIGRNNFQFYTSDMNTYTAERLELETGLRKALVNKEFIVYYQPQVDITTGRIVGSEALVRWQHPQRGLIPPNDFIPLAEETGLITAIGMWVLDQACRQNHQWHAEGFHDLTVAVNLSARQFNDPNLQREIFEVLRTSEFDPHALELEITESLSMYDVDSSIATMEAFSAKGISIAIDDFGTGFSSLSHLQLFPINKLKIDRSFISKIGDGTKNNLVRTIVTLAKQLELKVIAEGVETSEQLEFLRQLECNLVQGFYFGKPLPPDEFKLLLRQQPKAPLNQRR